MKPLPVKIKVVGAKGSKPKKKGLGDRAASALSIEQLEGSPCVHLGAFVESKKCKTCGNRGQLYAIHECDVYGKCSPSRSGEGSLAKCRYCEDYESVLSGTAESPENELKAIMDCKEK
jgi:hypothetical protein